MTWERYVACVGIPTDFSITEGTVLEAIHNILVHLPLMQLA